MVLVFFMQKRQYIPYLFLTLLLVSVVPNTSFLFPLSRSRRSEKKCIVWEDWSSPVHLNVKNGRTSCLECSNSQTPGDNKGYESDKMTGSCFQGAGQPRKELYPGDLPALLHEALYRNNFPEVDSGLLSMWDFSGDSTKYIFKNNVTEFIESAHETALEFPTSFYGVAMHGLSYEIETPVNMVGGEDGWIATQVVKTVSSDGRMRRWQWEMRKRRRPPNMGNWYVENIGSSDRKGDFDSD